MEISDDFVACCYWAAQLGTNLVAGIHIDGELTDDRKWKETLYTKIMAYRDWEKER